MGDPPLQLPSLDAAWSDDEDEDCFPGAPLPVPRDTWKPQVQAARRHTVACPADWMAEQVNCRRPRLLRPPMVRLQNPFAYVFCFYCLPVWQAKVAAQSSPPKRSSAPAKSLLQRIDEDHPMSRSAHAAAVSRSRSPSDSGSGSNVSSQNSSQSSSQNSSQNSSRRCSSRSSSLRYMSPLSEGQYENVSSVDRASSPSSTEMGFASNVAAFLTQQNVGLSSPQQSSRGSPPSTISSRDTEPHEQQQDDELAWRWVRNVEEAAARSPACTLSGVWRPSPVGSQPGRQDELGAQDAEVHLEAAATLEPILIDGKPWLCKQPSSPAGLDTLSLPMKPQDPLTQEQPEALPLVPGWFQGHTKSHPPLPSTAQPPQPRQQPPVAAQQQMQTPATPQPQSQPQPQPQPPAPLQVSRSRLHTVARHMRQANRRSRALLSLARPMFAPDRVPHAAWRVLDSELIQASSQFL